MRYIKIIYATVLPALLILFLGISGCQKNSEINSPSPRNLESQDYVIFDLEDSMNGITDASLDKQMGYDDPLQNNRKFRNNSSEGRNGRHLFRILRLLQITPEQVEEVRRFMQAHRDCVKEPHKAFREAAAPYLQAANEQRREILARFRNGEITREEAKELIKQVNIETREAIQNDPLVQAAQEEICACKITLLDNIASVLDERQIIIWNAWVEGLEGPCF